MESGMENINKKYEIDNYEIAMDTLNEFGRPMEYKLISHCIEARVYGLKCEIALLSDALNNTRKDRDKFAKENIDLVKQLEEKDKILAEKTAMLEEADVDYEQLLNECNAVKVKLAKTVEDNDNFYKINKQLKDENSRLTNRVAEYMDELKSKNAEIAALKEVVNTYRDEYYKYSDGLVTQYDEK